MNEWFYARGGQQSGPVSLEKLMELVKDGTLHPTKDLAWAPTMKDWIPVGQVPGVITASAISSKPVADSSNPYAAPTSAWNQATPAASGEGMQEIEPGSEPIRVGTCVERGFELTKRHFGTIALVGLAYLGIFIVLGIIPAFLFPTVLTGTPIQNPADVTTTVAAAAPNTGVVIINLIYQVLSQILSIFLSLGLCRIGLNLVSGKEVSVAMLFGGGKLLLRAVGASILFYLMVGLGLLLFVVPGIYLALRYGQFLNAMVDRNLGIKESFEYSSSLTTNNRWEMLLLHLLCILITAAGALACFVGLIFALPIAWLSLLVAYRWMQYGHRVTFDHPGTKNPLLSDT